MANKFEVQVVALDRFTKTFRNLNNQASKAARPLVNVHRQVGALAKEMHLDKAAKGMGKLSDAAVTLTRTLGLSLGPLESVLGAGGVVGGILATGAAAIGLGVRFASAGFEVARTSNAIGMSTRDLQRWRGAARLVGVPLDAMDHTLSSLGTTLQDAQFGRDPLALQALNKLGISIRTKNGLVDQNAALEDISNSLSKISDPHVRDVLANALHIDPATFPLLTQASAGVHKLQDEAERLGVVNGPEALKWSVEFTDSLNHMKVAIDGAANSLGSRLVPSMSKGVDYLSDRITQSKEHPFRAAGGEIFDFFAAGPRTVGAGARWLFGSTPGSTSADRTVSGQIGGPLQQGPYSAPGAGSTGGGLLDGRYVDPAVQAERDREAMRIVQQESASATNPADRAALQRELAARAAGASTNTLAPQTVKVEVAFKGAPAGTTATAKSSTDNIYLPTHIEYAMPSGDMP